MERFLIKANDALGAAIKAKAAEELQDPEQWIIGVLAAHAASKCGTGALAMVPVAADPARAVGRPTGAKKVSEVRVRNMSTEELQDFLEETGFISDGGVEPSFYPEGKRVDGTYEKKFVRMNPTTLTNEYCVGYYYDNKLVGVEPQNVVPTMSIGELVNALKKEGII